MNEILKQRLVGALILVALGVVFWPIIFVGHGEKLAADQRSIPPPPTVSTTDIDAPDQAGLRASPELDIADDELPTTGQQVADGIPASAVGAPGAPRQAEPADSTVPASPPAAKPAAKPAAAAVPATAPERLATDAAGVPVAWTLQVATVSSAEKAEDLRQQLLALKYKAYVTTLNSGGKKLFRVCIGPKFERVELEKLQASINAKFGVNSMVARYLP